MSALSKNSLHLWTKQSPLESLKTLLSDHLPEGTEVFLFGSRAKGTATEFSDYDLAFRTLVPLSFLEFLRVRAVISETPRRVDLVDLSRVQAGFAQEVMKTAVKL